MKPNTTKFSFLSAEDIICFQPYKNPKANIINETDLIGATAGSSTSIQSFGGVKIQRSIYDHLAQILISLSQGHPFKDGNKRTAYRSAIFFLYKNGYKIASPNAFKKFVDKCAEHRNSEEAHYQSDNSASDNSDSENDSSAISRRTLAKEIKNSNIIKNDHSYVFRLIEKRFGTKIGKQITKFLPT